MCISKLTKSTTMGQVEPGLTAGVPPVVTLSQRTEAVFEGLDLILRHHDVEDSIRKSLGDQLHKHLDTSLDETVWLKRMKYVLTYPLSKYLRNPPPPKPDVAFLPTGSLRRWMKARLNAFNRKNTHLWYSWLQCKRNSLPVSDDIVEDAYKKHLETLTKPDLGDEGLIDEIFQIPTFMNLLDEIRDKVTKTMSRPKFRGAYFEEPKGRRFEEMHPSKSACFEQSRAAGGQQGDLLGRCLVHPDMSEESYDIRWFCNSLLPTELYSMDYKKVYASNGSVRYTVVSQRCSHGYEDWQGVRSFSDEERVLRSRVGPINIKATIQAILEPMKIRVISKGESVPYYSCRPLQKAIHGAMRDMPAFRLIGRPFSATDMIDLAKLAGPKYLWFSIDYSAATDNLSWRYSGRIFRHIISGLSEDEQLIALDVLGPHDLYYPIRNGRGKVEYRGTQTNGQLMGSILSFPVLCLANAGVYLKTTEFDQAKWTDQQRLNHVLINGDDMLYAAPEELWERHIDIANRVGLEMSVGKAYKHHTYANVNSTSVHYSIPSLWNGGNRVDKTTPWKIDYLNAGLFYGKHKVQGGTEKPSDNNTTYDEEDECDRFWGKSAAGSTQTLKMLKEMEFGTDVKLEGITAPLNVILDGSLPGKRCELLKWFLTSHKDEVKRECLGVYTTAGKSKIFTRNLFVPIALGGMGVTPPLGFHYDVKPVQRKIAKSCINQLTCNGLIQTSSQLPLPGHSVDDYDAIESSPWDKPTPKKIMYSVGSNRDKFANGGSRIGTISNKGLMSNSAIPYIEHKSSINTSAFMNYVTQDIYESWCRTAGVQIDYAFERKYGKMAAA